MPKIIENLREDILAEAKKQVSEQGYKSTTIRSVANGCKIAVGTVYNYFKSKDMLIASFILEDWLECIRMIEKQPKENHRLYINFIYNTLVDFEKKHSALFSDGDAAKVFSIAFSEKHRLLRSQLSNLILPICSEQFTSEFVAEALLTWTMAGKSFDEIYSLLPERIK